MQESEIAVCARVGSGRSRWVGRTIYTFYDLEPLEWIGGSGTSPLEVALPGGVVGDVGLAVFDTPHRLHEGEEVVIFARRSTKHGALSPIASADAILPVVRDPKLHGRHVLLKGRSTPLGGFIREARQAGGRR
ncbi:MAG: hypothetical protein ACK5AZ_18215 [Bryobacteraceae bacterium]